MRTATRILRAATVVACFATAPASATAQDSGPTIAIWTEPLASAVVAAVSDEGGIWATLGASVPVSERWQVSGGVTFTSADWYPCHSRSTGGFAWLGPLAIVTAEREALRGFFVHPRLYARYFRTTIDEGATTFTGMCAETSADDFELGLGLDVGYQIRLGPVFLTPLVGASAGYCFNCPPGAPFYFGDMDIQIFPPQPGERINKVTLGLNLVMLQLGIAL